MFVLITVGNHSLFSSKDAFIMKGWQSTKLLLLLAFLLGDITTVYWAYTIHNTGYTVMHYIGYTVMHYTGYTVKHYTGYTVMHYTGYTVMHYTGYIQWCTIQGIYSDALYRVYTVMHYTGYIQWCTIKGIYSDALYRVYSDALYRVYSDALYRVYSDTLYSVSNDESIVMFFIWVFFQMNILNLYVLYIIWNYYTVPMQQTARSSFWTT